MQRRTEWLRLFFAPLLWWDQIFFMLSVYESFCIHTFPRPSTHGASVQAVMSWIYIRMDVYGCLKMNDSWTSSERMEDWLGRLFFGVHDFGTIYLTNGKNESFSRSPRMCRIPLHLHPLFRNRLRRRVYPVKARILRWIMRCHEFHQHLWANLHVFSWPQRSYKQFQQRSIYRNDIILVKD